MQIKEPARVLSYLASAERMGLTWIKPRTWLWSPRSLFRSRGNGAFAYLNEQAEIAKMAGDMESAITWWDIALATVENRLSIRPSRP